MPDFRSLFERLTHGRKMPMRTVRYQLVNSGSASFAPWDGNIYNSDIARSAIWTIAEAASKARFVHSRGNGETMQINPDPIMRNLLEQPNELMTMQDFIAKMVIQLEKYNNAFALIGRDPRGHAVSMYPLSFSEVELREGSGGDVFCKFRFRNAADITAPYSDIIHLRKHFDDNDFYGAGNFNALHGLMDIIDTTDNGMITAVKNSAVISWLLKFGQVLNPKDTAERVKEFSDNYLNMENNGYGVMATDPRYDAIQVENKSYVPNAAQMDRATKRLLMYFGVSEKIIMGDFNEDDWNSFYESRVEPILMQIAKQITLKCYSSKERAFGNRVYPESIAMQYASMSTKLQLVSMVDRGALLPNEWRRIMNLAPIEGGDKPIRRLDTEVISNMDGNAPNSQPIANLGNEEATDMDTNQGEQQPTQRRAETPERRDRIFEVRSINGGENARIVEGRAVVYDTPTVMYEIDGIQYIEVIARGALDGADMSDVPMKYNHSDSYLIVARHNAARPNRSNMELLVDNDGLLIRSDLTKTESARQLYEAIDAGLVYQMSFAFTVADEEYDKLTHTRTIKKIKKLWDVSAVDTPAYDTTSIYARNRFAAEAEAEKRDADAAQQRRKALSCTIDGLITIYGGNEHA